MEDISHPDIDVAVLVGKVIKAGSRTIWPVTRVTIVKGLMGKVLAIQAKPLAMLIIEPEGSYAVSFSGKPMTIEAIVELAPALGDVLEKTGEARQE